MGRNLPDNVSVSDINDHYGVDESEREYVATAKFDVWTVFDDHDPKEQVLFEQLDKELSYADYTIRDIHPTGTTDAELTGSLTVEFIIITDQHSRVAEIAKDEIKMAAEQNNSQFVQLLSVEPL